ncbi:MAG: hypothetical protein ACK4HV_00430 [Parachlamydiaceae bacterium]
MSAPQLSVFIRSVERQFQACLDVHDDAFFENENVLLRVRAISSKIACMRDKYELFNRLKIMASNLVDADFKKLKSSEKTAFLAIHLVQLNKEGLISFFNNASDRHPAKLSAKL